MGDAAEYIERMDRARDRKLSTSSSRSSSSGGRIKPSSKSIDDFMPGGSSGGGGKSVLQQIGEFGSALPAGIAQLGAQTWDSTVGNTGSLIQSTVFQQNENDIRNRKGVLGALQRTFANEEMQEAISQGRSLGDQFRAASPLLTGIGGSTMKTGGRLVDLGSVPFGEQGWDESQYGQAIKDSQIVGTLLEDVGNLALGGAVAGQTVAGGGRAVAASRAGAPLVGKASGYAGPSAYRAGMTARGNLPTAGGRGVQVAERIARTGRIVDEGMGRAMLSPLRIPSTLSRLVTGEGSRLGPRLASGRGLGQVIGDAVQGTDTWQARRDSGLFGRLADSRLLSKRSAPLREMFGEGQRQVMDHTETAVEATKASVRLTDGPVEQAAARLRTAGIADAVGSLGTLDAKTRRVVLGEMIDDGQLTGATKGMSREQAVDAFDLAIRSVTDPDSLADGQLGRLQAAQEAWEPVVDMQRAIFEDSYGVLDPRDPSVVAMLAGDEILPYEKAKVFQRHADEMERLGKTEERLSGKRDRIRSRIRLDDEMIQTGPKGLAERGRALDALTKKLLEVEGAEYLAEFLYRDGPKINGVPEWATLTDEALEARVRKDVRSELNSRALMAEAGEVLPGDILSDAVESSGLRSLPLQPNQKGRAAVRREAGAEARARQAGQDVDRLGRKRASQEQNLERLAGALESAIEARPRPKGLGKLRAALRAELNANADVRKAASAYTRLKNKLRDGEVLSDKEMTDLFTEIRRAALPYLDDVADNTWSRLLDEYGINDSIVLGDTHIDHAAQVLNEVAQRTGLDVEQVLSYGAAGRSGARPFFTLENPATGKKYARIVDGEVRAPGTLLDDGPAVRTPAEGLEVIAYSLADGDIDVAIQRIIDDVSTVIQANELRRWIKGIRGVKQKGGKRKSWLREGGMRAYLSSEHGIDMLDEVLSAMDDDPELVYAAFSDDPIGATRKIAVEWFDEGWADVPGEASQAAQAALRAADEAMGPERILLDGEDAMGPVVAEARREFAEAFSNPEVRGAAFDAAWARLMQDRARRVSEHAASTDPGIRSATRRVARGAGRAGERLGDVEGQARALSSEEKLARTRAERGADDLEGAEFSAGLEQIERGGRFFTAEGKKIGDLARVDRELAGVRRRIAQMNARLADDLAEAMEKVESAPAKFRMAVTTARAASEVIDNMRASATTPGSAAIFDQVQAGLVTSTVNAIDVLNPDFVTGGHLPGQGAGGARAGMVRKTKSEYLKEGDLAALSDGAQAVMITRSAELQGRNQVAKNVMDKYARTGDDILTEAGVDVDGMRRQALLDEVNAASDVEMVAINPRKPFVRPEEIGPDTLFMPRWVRDAMEHQFAPASLAEKMAQLLIDNPTRLWKHGVLALSPRWHMGNMVGNVLMAWAAGIPPHQQLALMREARQMMKDGTMPGRLRGTGTGAEHHRMLSVATDLAAGGRALDSAVLRELEQGQNRLQRPIQAGLDRVGGAVKARVDPTSRTGRAAAKIGRGAEAALQPVQSSYNFNGVVDDLFHNIVYLDSMKRGAGVDEAVQQALKVAGDFSTMTKFERQIVRRVLPFYSWMRHITKLSADLAMDHPLRAAWTLHLWTLFADDEDVSDLPSLFGTINTGPNEYIRARNYMPFGTVMDIDPTDPLGTIAGSASPVFKVPIEVGTGMKFGPAGIEPMTRPGAFGARPGPGWIGLDATVNRLSSLTPQTRALMQLGRNAGDRTVRYDTGQDVMKDGAPIPDVNAQGNWEILGRSLLGLPIPVHSDAAAMRARKANR